MINKWAEKENQFQNEQDNAWTTYRKIISEGISRYADINVRDLFQEFSILQSYAEVRVSVLESARDRAKLELELEEARLLRAYTTGPMNKRLTDVKATDVYQNAQRALADKEDGLTIQKGIARALTIAANALSREITARMKS